MRRLATSFALIASCLAQVASALAVEQGPPPATTSYRLSVSLDAENHRVSGTGTIEFTNRSDATLTELWFHLYPNAFSDEKSRFLRASAHAHRSRRALSYPGRLDVIRLALADSAGSNLWAHADPTTPGDPEDTTDRRVPLPAPCEPGETLRLFVKFETQLPSLIERMGWVEDFLAVAQWFPKLARLERDGTWRHFPYEPVAEFSADFGNYDISIDAPGRLTIAAAGRRSEVARSRGRVTTRFQLDGVHDFAFFAWERFEQIERTHDGVRIRVFAPLGHARNAETELSLAEFGISHFQRLFGKYPYPELIVVHPPDVAAPAGGMEYPGLIVTGGPWYSTWTGRRTLEAVTLHELAHQWFYGIVANDEARYPVLDEGLATWSEIESLTMLFGTGSAFSGLGVTVSASALASAIGTRYGESGPLSRPASSFRDFSSLSATIYARAAALLETLGNVYGTEKLKRALNQYTVTERFRHPTPDALIAAVASEMGPEAGGNLRTALDSDGWVDYAVSGLTRNKEGAGTWKSTVSLERRGSLEFPVAVSMKLASGNVIHRTWPTQERTATWEIVGQSPIDSVMIDPSGSITIETERENNAKFVDKSPCPTTLLERLAYVVEILLSGMLP